MDCLSQFDVTPTLRTRAAALAALRERQVGAPVQVAWIPAR
jgi:hypothetical protein